MGDIAFFGFLALTAAATAAWLLHDFGERWRDARMWPRRLASRERVPQWMCTDSAQREQLALPPTLGPARLPSFARHATVDVDAKQGSPRRGHRPRRSRTSTLRPAV